MDHFKNCSAELIVCEIDGAVFTEEWLASKEGWGLFQISSFGRIKRLGRASRQVGGKWIKEKILRPTKTQKGYLRIVLRNGDMKRSRYVHRLVALEFLNNPEGKPDINHKTGVKTDNHFSQLEWCTPQENNEHGFKNGLLKRGKTIRPYIKKGRSHIVPTTKKVVNTSTGESYKSALEVSKATGMTLRTFRRMLSGERYNDTPFRYVGQEGLVKERPIVEVQPSPMAVFNLSGELVATFRYTKEAAVFAKTKISEINSFLNGECNQVKGFRFKYIDEDGNHIEPKAFLSKRKPPKPPKIAQPTTPSKEIIKMDTFGNKILLLPSLSEAAKHAGSDKANFRKAIQGKRKGRAGYYKGFIYRYA